MKLKPYQKLEINTVLNHLLRQRSGSVGSTDTLNKRKRKEGDRREAEKELLGKFEKTRRVTRIPPKRETTESSTEETEKMQE